MSNAARAHIELPADLQAFAEEKVSTGEFSSVEEVVYDALQKQRFAAFRDSLDAGIADLDAGYSQEQSPAELMAEISAELGLDS